MVVLVFQPDGPVTEIPVGKQNAAKSKFAAVVGDDQERVMLVALDTTDSAAWISA